MESSRIMKIFRIVVIALAFVALIVFMILDIRAGIETQLDKIYLALYILLIIWAGTRVYTLAKDLIQK